MGSICSTLNEKIRDNPLVMIGLNAVSFFGAWYYFWRMEFTLQSINKIQKTNHELMTAASQTPLEGGNTDTCQADGLQRMERWRNSTFRLRGGKMPGTCVLFEDYNNGKIGLLTAYHVLDPTHGLSNVCLENENCRIELKNFRGVPIRSSEVSNSANVYKYVYCMSTDLDYTRQEEFQNELVNRREWTMDYDITLCFFKKEDIEKQFHDLEKVIAKKTDIIGLDEHLKIRSGSCFIIGFPKYEGRVQEMELLHNDADTCNFGRGVGFIYYDCPTEPETSGSGIYDCRGYLVGVHVMCYFKSNKEKHRLAYINRGTLLSAFVRHCAENKTCLHFEEERCEKCIRFRREGVFSEEQIKNKARNPPCQNTLLLTLDAFDFI